MIRTEMVELPEGSIEDFLDSYRYLGIPQAHSNYEEAVQRSTTVKPLLRARQVLESQLNRKNKIQAINTCTLPVIRLPAGMASWTLEEMQGNS